MDGCLWHRYSKLQIALSIADAFAFSPRPVNRGRTPWQLAKENNKLEVMALLRPAPRHVQVSIRGSRFSNSSCSELMVALFVLSFTCELCAAHHDIGVTLCSIARLKPKWRACAPRSHVDAKRAVGVRPTTFEHRPGLREPGTGWTLPLTNIGSGALVALAL